MFLCFACHETELFSYFALNFTQTSGVQHGDACGDAIGSRKKSCLLSWLCETRHKRVWKQVWKSAKTDMNLFPFCWLGWEGGIQRGVRCMCLVGFKHGICSVQLEVHFHFLGMILVVRFNLFLPISCLQSRILCICFFFLIFPFHSYLWTEGWQSLQSLTDFMVHVLPIEKKRQVISDFLQMYQTF